MKMNNIIFKINNKVVHEGPDNTKGFFLLALLKYLTERNPSLTFNDLKNYFPNKADENKTFKETFNCEIIIKEHKNYKEVNYIFK